MKNKKKHKKLVQSARVLAETIMFQNNVRANLDYCLEHQTICRVCLNHESWTAAHRWWVLGTSSEFVYAARVRDFLLDGYEIVPFTAITEVVPLVHYTEQCALLQVPFPQEYPDLDLDSMTQLLTGLSRLDMCVSIAHESVVEEDSHIVIGRIEKIGKKRVTVRGLDISDVTWMQKPDKFLRSEINRIKFGTRLIVGYEKLAMSYEAFMRTVNETIHPPEELDDFEDGRDLREEQSEDMVDPDDLLPSEDMQYSAAPAPDEVSDEA